MKRLVVIRGGGELATASAIYLHNAGFRVLILEQAQPTSTRRMVSFADAVYDKKKVVERVTCRLATDYKDAEKRLKDGEIVLMVDPVGRFIKEFEPKVVIDGILAHRNFGTNRKMAEHTLALGPGFCAGRDVDVVIDTMRGHNLGRIVREGYTTKVQGTPDQVDSNGTAEHIIFSPASGKLEVKKNISFMVKEGEVIAKLHVAEKEVIDIKSPLTGVLRGSIHDGYYVEAGQKILDVNPHLTQTECFSMSDKARCIAGSVLMVVVGWENAKKKRRLF